MPTTRVTQAALAALLAAAALAGSASAAPAHAGHKRLTAAHAGNSTIQAPEVAPPPTWPTNPQPIVPSDVTDTARALDNPQASGLDWGSAGIGAAGSVAACAIALAGTLGLRRRRHVAQPRSLATD